MHSAIDIAHVLKIDRTVESELRADCGERGRIGLGAGDRNGRIGGNYEGDREGDQRGAEQDRRAEDDSPDEVSEHRARSVSA